MDKRMLLQMTADIVASHASMNELGREDLLGEIDQVYKKLAGLAGDMEVGEFEAEETQAEPEALAAAVPLEAAFGAEKVFCMVCGKGMKTLKRHLSTAHDMKPGQYRKAFDIPAGTPLVAKNYSEARKKMAQDLNLAERLVKARAARGKKKT
ncbi:MAG: MucR family transcriptional regulator [Deferrisomatales bacterium]|nr:MucR family transcriptional regulator [Deferrisomatales bacterium]HSH71152.1 MucR family transcriptional regulator [Deferrisomatales bacterium]